MRKTVVAILKKLLHTVILLLVLSFVVFSFIRLIPGDPVKNLYGSHDAGGDHRAEAQRTVF